MSMFTKRGAAAVESAQAEKDTSSSALVPFTSGTTYKVRVKSKEDSVEYYGYGMFGKVNTYVPKNPAARNEKGYVTSGATPWDLAADMLYAEAKALKDAGDEKGSESLRNEAYAIKGKPKYLVGFGSLADGTDIVVDLTPKQAASVFAAIKKYEKKLGVLAFELAKTGSSTNTVVSFSPILDMDEDLTEAERANFDKCGAAPFNFEIFETCLYVADKAEQVKNLVIAGFDIGRLGLSIGASAQPNAQANATTTQSDEAAPITGEAPAVNF